MVGDRRLHCVYRLVLPQLDLRDVLMVLSAQPGEAHVLETQLLFLRRRCWLLLQLLSLANDSQSLPVMRASKFQNITIGISARCQLGLDT
jgi:hypothetical protein